MTPLKFCAHCQRIMKCVSLFSCAGFGDLGLESAGVHTISACELVAERANLLRANFPNTKVFEGDIWQMQDEIVRHAEDELADDELDIIIASPPCQGYSSNGMGRISQQIRKGKRDANDPRNRLILPAVNIIRRLKPKLVIIENVPGMRHSTIVNEAGVREDMGAFLYRSLPDHVLASAVLNTADYGVPQTRRRLITLGIRVDLTSECRSEQIFHESPSFLHPKPTHGTADTQPHVSLRQCIGHLPKLDSVHRPRDDKDPFHRVPTWKPPQYACMKATPEGETAFHNTRCVSCGTHNANIRLVRCERCHTLLPRPLIQEKNGAWRLIRAFKTAYRRMHWDKPANALTTNSGVISSDVKGHPTEHRVLSLREIMIVATVASYPGTTYDFRYTFPQGDSDRLIREVLGECIPPLLTSVIMTHLAALLSPSAPCDV